MVFTLIFAQFGVKCEGEDARKLLHTKRYNEKSLHRMGYTKVDDRFVCRASTQGTATSDSSDDDDKGDGDEDDEN